MSWALFILSVATLAIFFDRDQSFRQDVILACLMLGSMVGCVLVRLLG